MTAKTIEDLLIQHASRLASHEEKILAIRGGLADSTERNDERVRKLEEDNSHHQLDIADLNLKIALADQQIAEVKLLIELRRSYRWAMIVLFVGAVLSFIGSAVIALYVKQK